MIKIKISVIIPCYNSSLLLAKCLESIRASSYKFYEIIVIDDCSKDDSAAVAKKHGAMVVSLNQNSGPAHARNEGVKVATGEILFFVDSDVEFFQDTLTMVANAFSDPALNVCSGIYSKEPANKGTAALYKALFMYYHFTRSEISNYKIFNAACGAIRKVAYQKIGGFNSKIKWGIDLENDEFGARATEIYANPVILGIKVKHNFPNFFKLLTTMFRRTYYWTLFFLQRKKFDATITTPAMGIANGIAPIIVLFALLQLIDKNLIIFTVLFSIIYVVSYLKFYFFVINEVKFSQFFSIVFISFCVSVFVGAGAMLAFLKKLINRLFFFKESDEFETIV